MICKVLFLLYCSVLYMPWSVTWSDLTTGIMGVWEETNFIGRQITDTRLVQKNVAFSCFVTLHLKLARGCGGSIPQFRLDEPLEKTPPSVDVYTSLNFTDPHQGGKVCIFS